MSSIGNGKQSGRKVGKRQNEPNGDTQHQGGSHSGQRSKPQVGTDKGPERKPAGKQHDEPRGKRNGKPTGKQHDKQHNTVDNKQDNTVDNEYFLQETSVGNEDNGVSERNEGNEGNEGKESFRDLSGQVWVCPPNEQHMQGRMDFYNAKRRGEVAKLYLRAHSYPEIAEKLRITTNLVGKDVRAIHQEWKEQRLTDFDEQKQLELAKLEGVERMAAEAWERSCKNGEVVTERTKTARRNVWKNGKPTDKYELIPVETVQEKVTRGAVGDPRFLDIIRECVILRLRMMGLLSTDKPTNTQTVNINWSQMYAPIVGYAPNAPVQGGTTGQIGMPGATVIDGGQAVLPGTGPQCPIEARILELESKVVPADQQITDRPAVYADKVMTGPTVPPR